MAKGKTLNIAPPSPFETVVSKFTGKDLAALRQVIFGIKRMNPTLYGSQIKWLAKNEKKIDAAFKAHLTAEQVVIDKYSEKTEDGHVIFWDGYDEPLNKDMQPLQEGEVQSFGYKVFTKDNALFDAATGNPTKVPHQNFIPYVSDPEKRKIMTDEVNSLQDELYEVFTYRLSDELAENIRLPTAISTGPGKQPTELSADLLGKIIDLGDDTED